MLIEEPRNGDLMNSDDKKAIAAIKKKAKLIPQKRKVIRDDDISRSSGHISSRSGS